MLVYLSATLSKIFCEYFLNTFIDDCSSLIKKTLRESNKGI